MRSLRDRLQAGQFVVTVLQVACRDRNRLALQSDLLSAWVLGIGNGLVITGDPVEVGGRPHAKAVFDVSSTSLLQLIAQLNAGHDNAGHPLEGKTDFFCGATVNLCLESPGPELQLQRRQKPEAFSLLFPLNDLWSAEPGLFWHDAFNTGHRHARR
jgi:5,10-methylenetetrahydrofolate reductase